MLIQKPTYTLTQFFLNVPIFWEATPEEIEAANEAKGTKVQTKRSAKAKAKAPAKAPAAVTPVEKHDRSPAKENQPSPNPVKPKKLRGKQPDPNRTPESTSQADMIAQLVEVGHQKTKFSVVVLFSLYGIN